MSIPTIDQLRAAAEVLVVWGFWAIVYGAIAMCIGIVIIALCNKQIVKYLR